MKKRINLKFEIKKAIVFYFYVRRLSLVNFFRFKFLRNFNSKKTIIGSLVYFLFLIGFIFLSGKFIDSSFDKSDTITFFTATAAMIGGILAIVFSLSMLLMSNAAARIPVGFYEIITKDWSHVLIFFFIGICSLTIFAFALLFQRVESHLSIIFQITLFLVGVVFYLTFLF